MSERADVREWVEFQWPYLMSFLGGVRRVEALARETGAFERGRKIGRPEVLLQLILMWAVAERSLMDTAMLAAEEGLADVSDVALVKRFAKAGPWLAALLSDLLGEAAPNVGMRVRLLDATTVTRPGRKSTDQRLHFGLDLGSNRIDSVELSDARGAEGFERFSVAPAEILVADRAYGTRKGMAHVGNAGAFFIVPFAWPRVPLMTAEGKPFLLFKALRSLPEARAGEFSVRFVAPNGQIMPARLVAIRKSEPATQAARKKALRGQTKHGNHSVDIRTLEAAGYLFVLTNAPQELTAQSVLDLYRLRWQIETKFKTLKSVLHLGTVPARTDAALQVYLLAKLLMALLIDLLVEQAESFSPWGYPLLPDQLLAHDAAHP
jgi:hypothetical protein